MPHSEKPRVAPHTPATDDKATSPVLPTQEPPDLWKLIQGWVWKRFGMVGVVILAVVSLLWTQWDHVKQLPGVESLVERFVEDKFDIGGKWRTQVLINPYNDTQRSMCIFEFTQAGDTIYGTVTETDPGNFSYSRPIIDGKIKGNVLSFYTNEETYEQPFKRWYIAVLSEKKHEIVFTRFNDLGGRREKFIARRD